MLGITNRAIVCRAAQSSSTPVLRRPQMVRSLREHAVVLPVQTQAAPPVKTAPPAQTQVPLAQAQAAPQAVAEGARAMALLVRAAAAEQAPTPPILLNLTPPTRVQKRQAQQRRQRLEFKSRF